MTLNNFFVVKFIDSENVYMLIGKLINKFTCFFSIKLLIYIKILKIYQRIKNLFTVKEEQWNPMFSLMLII